MSLLGPDPLSTVQSVTDPLPSDAATSAQEPSVQSGAPRVRAGLLARLLAPSSPSLVYAGVGLIALGIAVLAYTWSRVAGTALVPLQIPYIISGGFTGLGLEMLGVLAIFVGTKRREAWQRERRLEDLVSVMEALIAKDRERS